MRLMILMALVWMTLVAGTLLLVDKATERFPEVFTKKTDIVYGSQRGSRSGN